MHLECEDPDDTAARMLAEGSEVLIPIEDRFYGKREGRIRDPFGHSWILSKHLETLDDDELARRNADWAG